MIRNEKESGTMRWMALVVVLAVATGAWAEEKPAGEMLGDPTASLQILERDSIATQDRLAAINTKLDNIRVGSAREKDEEKRNAMLRDSQGLHEQRAMEQIRLNEMMEQLRVRRWQQLQQAFGQECDLFLAGASDISGLSLVGIVDVDGRRMLQFWQKDEDTLWTVDPQKVASVRITTPVAAKTTQPAK